MLCLVVVSYYPLFLPKGKAIFSDGHGNLFPHGYTGTGMVGMGTGTIILPRGHPTPVVTGHGSDCRLAGGSC